MNIFSKESILFFFFIMMIVVTIALFSLGEFAWASFSLTSVYLIAILFSKFFKEDPPL